MSTQTISQISKAFSLSTRTLRYYEEIGLIVSEKAEDYAYRVYSDDTVRRLEQIIVLRKLRIPLKQIAFILKCESASEIIDAFRRNLAEVDDEITALSTIREIIAGFVSRLDSMISENGETIRLNLMDDTVLLEAADALAVQKTPLKEEKTAVDLQMANKKLSKLTDRDVRIIYLPPMTVASVHIASGEGSELVSAEILDNYIADADLQKLYPAARVFGFNNPDGLPDNDPAHGYERWISIPDDMEVPKPLVKKRFEGGLYAAHMIPMGAFEEWGWLYDWVFNNSKFDFRWNTIDGICGWLEEHLNYWGWNKNSESSENQLDLLIPVKLK